MKHNFWSSFSSLGTIFTQTFRILAVNIFQTCSIFMFKLLADIRTVNQRPPHTICFNHSMLIHFLRFEGPSFLESSFPSWKPSLTSLSHLKTCIYTMVPFTQTCKNIWEELTEFSLTGRNISSLFLARFDTSFYNAQSLLSTMKEV